MTEITFGRLQDLPPREAWAHEAHKFTPWLAENIDHLSDAIGIPLELTGQEVRVETFAADIIARNPLDDSVVLIENQLEATDHTHLGQIMTYLAGLGAQTVVWIAPSFREPHLSAIRWLNEHTAEGFAFFAVRLRVVRIADSPYAPIFEVVEKPNDWDRKLRTETEAFESELTNRRTAFWRAFLERHPDAARLGLKAGHHSNAWIKAPGGSRVALYLAKNSCGIYVRGAFNTPIEKLIAKLLPHQAELERRLEAPLKSDEEPNWLLLSTIRRSFSDEQNWPAIIDWQNERLKTYLAALDEVLAGDA